jgi:hypothetical protein
MIPWHKYTLTVDFDSAQPTQKSRVERSDAPIGVEGSKLGDGGILFIGNHFNSEISDEFDSIKLAQPIEIRAAKLLPQPSARSLNLEKSDR